MYFDLDFLIFQQNILRQNFKDEHTSENPVKLLVISGESYNSNNNPKHIQFSLLLCNFVRGGCLTSFLAASSSVFGVRIWAVETVRMEWRCASVGRLLCDVLFIFITEKSCSHTYVLTNTESLSSL